MTLDKRFDGLPTRELAGGLTLIDAKTHKSRRRGLGGLESLPPEQALQIPTSSVHTFSMKFPLDLIWLSRDGTVVRVDREIPRGKMRACFKAKSVIEVAAGHADAFVDALSN
ncbi:MAG: DUF192 domain-containing protein [Solirubrobacterales bacterium]|nr:DUF192 domain-containing protein [Solirubrobacterales bacterium]